MDDHGTGSMRQRRSEPSWPTVIATTVRLWVERHETARRWTVRTRRVSLAVVAGVIVVVATTAILHRSPAPAAAPSRGLAADAPAGSALSSSTTVRGQAAAWVARQVASDAIVACDPAMCAALQVAGLTAARLDVLRTSAGDPLGSDVVVATAAVRSQFGGRLGSVYAPLIIASFGTGAGRIDIRAIAPDGAASYEAALAADMHARATWGSELARNPRISLSATAKAALDAGKVDPRLLLALDAMAGQQPLRIVAFGDPSPGASAAIPYRSAEIAATGAGSGARLRSLLSFIDGQRPPYLPAQAGIHGTSVLSVEYSAPSPLGLLGGR
jgi:hypothetical protein